MSITDDFGTIPADDRYSLVKDYPFTWEMVNLSGIQIQTFQRTLDEKRVKQISSNWCPPLAMPLVLNYTNGIYYCIDGQHTFNAALRRGIKELYAKVFEDLPIEVEAWLFSKLQEDRRGLTPQQKWEPKLAMNDPSAMRIMEIMRDLGLAFGKKADNLNSDVVHIGAVKAVESIYHNKDHGGPLILKETLSVINEAYGGNAEYFKQQFMFGVQRALSNNIRHFNRPRLVATLKQYSMKDIRDVAYDLMRNTNTMAGYAKQYEMAIVKIYNDGVGKYKPLHDTPEAWIA